MRRTASYALAGLVLLTVTTGALWAWLSPEGRRGILVAAGIAWGVQVVAFGLLVMYRHRGNRFLAAWVGGTVVRMAVVLLAAWVVMRESGLAPAPTLLGLAGFLFALLLLEPVFLSRALARDEPETSTSGRDELGE